MSHHSTFQAQDQRSPTMFGLSDLSVRPTRGSSASPALESIPRALEMDHPKSRNLQAVPGSSPMPGDAVADVSAFGTEMPPGPTHWPRQFVIERFYRNDGPWTPPGIVATRPDDHRGRNRSGLVGSRAGVPTPYIVPWRTTSTLPSECDTHDQRGPLLSDSGYGTRHSESASVYGDVDRSHETQSLAGQLEYYNPFGPSSDAYTREANLQRERWTNSSQAIPLGEQVVADGNQLICGTCKKVVKTRSELNKHDQRHNKPNVCDFPGCPRAVKGFGTTNDLDRHKRSVHPEVCSTAGSRFVCCLGQCQHKHKIWPRADNFRSHLKRVHHMTVGVDDDLDRFVYRPSPVQSQFPPVLEGVGTAVEYFPTFDGAEGDALPSPWPDQKSPDLDLAQNGSLPVDMDRSDIAMEFQESLAQPFGDDEDQSRDQDQDISQDLADLSSPSMDVEETAIPTSTSENASLVDKTSGQDGTYIPTDPVSRDEAALNLDDSRSKSQQSQADEEHLADVGSCAAVGLEGVGVPKKDLRACLSDDGSSATCSEEHGPADTDSPSCQSSKSDAERSPSTDDPAADDSDDDEEEKDQDSTTFQAKSSTFESADPDDDEQVLQFLKKLKDEGKLDELCKKVNRLAANKAGPAPVAARSDNFPCSRCSKTFNRKCELKKHLKRHEKPYGCTFASCPKRFGSKNDWKRHENSQHFQLEVWKCDEKPADRNDEQCGKVCHRRETFKHHLQKDHKIADAKRLDDKIERCRIGRNCETRFWCGFCQKIVEIKHKGISAWSERFNHIDDHFSGRNAPKKEINEWKNVDPEQPDADLNLRDSSPCSPAELRDLAQPPRQAQPSGAATAVRQKKRKAQDEDEPRDTKRPRGEANTVWTCCNCGSLHNVQTTSSCVGGNCEHRCCDSCPRETVYLVETRKGRSTHEVRA